MTECARTRPPGGRAPNVCREGDSTRGEKLLCEGMLFPACVVGWGWEAKEPFLHLQVFKGTSIPARPGPALR